MRRGEKWYGLGSTPSILLHPFAFLGGREIEELGIKEWAWVKKTWGEGRKECVLVFLLLTIWIYFNWKYLKLIFAELICFSHDGKRWAISLFSSWPIMFSTLFSSPVLLRRESRRAARQASDSQSQPTTWELQFLQLFFCLSIIAFKKLEWPHLKTLY